MTVKQTSCIQSSCREAAPFRVSRTNADGSLSYATACAAHTDLLMESFLAVKYGGCSSITFERLSDEACVVAEEIRAAAARYDDDYEGWAIANLRALKKDGTSDLGPWALFVDTSGEYWTFSGKHCATASKAAHDHRPLRVKYKPVTLRNKLYRNVTEVAA
jgi:hypothetical protein